jgi:NitT/TauT family transport system substrate-binding protein
LLFDSRQIPGEILDVVAMRESVVTKSVAADALINGWFRALDYLQKHPDDVARRVAPHEGVTPEQFLKSLKVFTFLTFKKTKNLNKTNKTSIEAVSRLAKFMVEKVAKESGKPYFCV